MQDINIKSNLMFSIQMYARTYNFLMALTNSKRPSKFVVAKIEWGKNSLFRQVALSLSFNAI